MKNIVISGGSDGLGKALARGLAAKGNKVVILSTNETKLKAAAEEASCTYKVCDVSDWHQVQTAVEAIIADLGSVDVLVNNAGVGYTGKIGSLSPGNVLAAYRTQPACGIM